MVLDLIISPHLARKQPWRILGAAFIFVTFGVLVNIWLPSVKGSTIVFAMIPAIPLFWVLTFREEVKEEKYAPKPKQSFIYHRRLIETFAFLFIGAALGYAFWFIALPQTQSSITFSDQIGEIKALRLNLNPASNAFVTGAVSAKGETLALSFNEPFFWELFNHNLGVLVVLFALTIVYGMGALYVLLWNASVLGVYMGMQLQAGGAAGALVGLIGLMPHGILEIGGYLLASIAGGLFSVAIMRRRVAKTPLSRILLDAGILTALSVIFLLVGAALEASF